VMGRSEGGVFTRLDGRLEGEEKPRGVEIWPAARLLRNRGEGGDWRKGEEMTGGAGRSVGEGRDGGVAGPGGWCWAAKENGPSEKMGQRGESWAAGEGSWAAGPLG
jgi:hypothetical protein